MEISSLFMVKEKEDKIYNTSRDVQPIFSIARMFDNEKIFHLICSQFIPNK